MGGKIKTFTFTFKEGESYNQEVIENERKIPWEVIKAPGFSISSFCEGEAFITLNQIEISILENGFDEKGHVPGTPTLIQ